MKQEKLVGKAAVKGTMLKAHLSWAREHIGEDLSRLRTYLDPESFKFLTTPGAITVLDPAPLLSRD